MTKLHLITGITPSLQRLLEDGGIASVEELARQEPGALVQRLARLAKTKGIRTGAASEELEPIVHLVQLARKLVDDQGVPSGLAGATNGVGDLSVNLDDVPEAISVRPAAPVPAAPVPAAPIRLRPANVAGAGRPAATPLNEPVRAKANEPERPGPPTPKFRDFQAYAEGRTGVAPLPRKLAEDEREVEGALKRLNYKPGEPIPRLVRRGVPYPRPILLIFCSLIVLASRLLIMAVLIGTPVVLWPAFIQGDTTHLISFLWVIGVCLVSCLFYFIFAVRPRCRVCTNHIFWSKRCTKNAKAHRVPGLGPVSSLALHALLFGWFRCMYCGTAIRLKFVADPERSG